VKFGQIETPSQRTKPRGSAVRVTSLWLLWTAGISRRRLPGRLPHRTHSA